MNDVGCFGRKGAGRVIVVAHSGGRYIVGVVEVVVGIEVAFGIVVFVGEDRLAADLLVVVVFVVVVEGVVVFVVVEVVGFVGVVVEVVVFVGVVEVVVGVVVEVEVEVEVVAIVEVVEVAEVVVASVVAVVARLPFVVAFSLVVIPPNLALVGTLPTDVA